MDRLYSAETDAWCTDSPVTGWKVKHSWNVVRMITCPQAHHLSDTFPLGNHLERVKSSNEFYYSKVFFTSFLPRLKPFTNVKSQVWPHPKFITLSKLVFWQKYTHAQKKKKKHWRAARGIQNTVTLQREIEKFDTTMLKIPEPITKTSACLEIPQYQNSRPQLHKYRMKIC